MVGVATVSFGSVALVVGMVAAEAFAGALCQPSAHLIALGQDSRMVDLRDAAGEIGGGLAGRLGGVGYPVGVGLGQRRERSADPRDLPAL